MAEREELFRFDDFLLNKQARTLDRVLPDGKTIPIQIGSRALQILCLLVDRRGQIITSSQIMDAVWPDVAVEQNNLTVQISALRRVLDAGRASGSCIQNISGRGYRLFPTVTEMSPASLGLPGTAPLTDGQVAAGPVEGDAAPGGQPEKGAARATVPGAALPSTTRAAWRRGVWLALFVTCIATLTGAVLWSFGGLGTSRVAAVAPPSVSVPVDRPRLSFVVLPFRNLGGEGLDDATVDAITEDLTSDLSRGYGFFVISRSSALTYKGKSVDLKRVGEEMGVRYVVEGSVRKIDGALLVNAQLVSTETGQQIWSDRVGIARDGLSYSFDDIVRQIAHALFVNVVDVEGARIARERPANPDVADLMLEARAVSQLPSNPQRHSQRIALLERAAELDPSSANVLASLAEALLDSIAFDSGDDPTVPGKLARVEGLVRAAELLQPSDKREKLVMFTRVYLLFKQSRCAEVIPAAQQTIVAQPNLISTSTFLGLCLMFDGRAAEAIPAYQHSIRLSPRHPALHLRYRFVGYAQLFRGHYEEALVWFDKSLGANPSDNTRSRATTFAAIAAAQALSDEIAKARASELKRHGCGRQSPPAAITPTGSPARSMPNRSSSCGAACGSPASATMRMRISMPRWRPTMCCTASMKHPRPHRCRADERLARLTWRRCCDSGSRWCSTSATHGAVRFRELSGSGGPASAAARRTSIRTACTAR